MSPGADTEAPAVAIKAEAIQWDVDMEVQLFYAMAPHKPVGVNKYFHMTAIWQKLSNSIARDITPEDIWKHLETLYDIPMLDDTEPIPFPNEETEFSLPESEFGEYLKKKALDISLPDDNEGSFDEPLMTYELKNPPSPPLAKSSTPKGSVRSTSKDSTPKSRKESSGGSRDGKTRKESGSSHASTDTHRSDKDYGSRSDRRRDSRDSNTSGTRDSSSGRKSSSYKKTPKSRTGRSGAETVWDEEPERSGRGRRRATTSTPPPMPAKRRRT